MAKVDRVKSQLVIIGALVLKAAAFFVVFRATEWCLDKKFKAN